MNQSSIILFDGVCNFCAGVVQFVIRRDKRQYFRFAALQSEAGSALAAQHGVDSHALKSFLLIENGQLYSRSTAALRVCKHLGAGWPLLYGLLIVPAFIRNAIYDWVARNRYRWFGKKEACMVPTAAMRERFL